MHRYCLSQTLFPACLCPCLYLVCGLIAKFPLFPRPNLSLAPKRRIFLFRGSELLGCPNHPRCNAETATNNRPTKACLPASPSWLPAAFLQREREKEEERKTGGHLLGALSAIARRKRSLQRFGALLWHRVNKRRNEISSLSI